MLGDATPSGAAGNGGAGTPALSEDGRYVAFVSLSTDLVDRNGDGIADSVDDSNGHYDVFRRDMLTGRTQMVSLDANGNQAVSGAEPYPAISADGRFVAFATNASLGAGDYGSERDVYLWHMPTKNIERGSL